tara:strand:- start:5542 stop:6705 length:1164 start_codon:yes stop_codon:yes gene_type:complete
MKKADNIVLFLSTLSYVLFDREGYIGIFYLMQLVFIGYYFVFVFHRNVIWVNKSKDVLKTYGAFCLFCVLSVIWSVDKDESFSKSKTVFIILINSVILYDYLNKTQSFKYILLAILSSTYINFFIILKIIPDNPMYWDNWRFQGTRDNPNYLAVLQLISVFSAIIIKHFFIFKSKIISILVYCSFFVSSYIIFMTASKKGMLFCISLLIYFIIDSLISKKNKIYAYSFLLVFLYFGYDMLSDLLNNENSLKVINRITEFSKFEGTSTNERIRFIEDGFESFLNHPFLGTGISSLKSIFGTYSHSNFIEILAGIGFFGFIIYYRIYYLLIKKVFKQNIYSIKIFYSIFTLTLFTLDIAQVTYYYKFHIFFLIFFVFIIENSEKLKIKN